MPFYLPDGRLHYFAHVPKCGGQSVEAHLEARFGPLGFINNDFEWKPEGARWSRSSPQHIPWTDLMTIIPEAWVASVFTVTRHPVLRLVSAYNFQSTRLKRVPPGLTIDAWFDEHLAMRGGLPYHLDNHLRPQSDFAPDDAVHFRLEGGLAPLVAWLDEAFGPGPAEAIGHKNDSDVVPDGFETQDGVSPGLAAKIAEVYEKDFTLYGYDAAPPRIPVVRQPVRTPGSSSVGDVARLAAYRAKRRLKFALRSVRS